MAKKMASETPATPATNLSQYALLRTILDSLETGALRYYLGADSHAQQEARFKYLRDKLTPIIHHIWEEANDDPDDPCPDGYHDCQGYCVSYPCTG
jgi:hypothetical protein